MKAQIIVIHMLLEEIKQRDVDRWKKEYSMFSKNIRRIKSAKDLFNVYTAYGVWHPKFEQWIYKSLLSTQQQKERKRKLMAEPEANDLRSVAWSFIIQCQPTDLFLNLGYRGHGNTLIKISTYKGFERDWEVGYEDFQKIRKQRYASYQRLGLRAFKAIQKYWNVISFDGQEKVPDMLKQERVKIGPVTAKVFYAEDDERAKKNIKTQIGYIKKSFADLKKLGLGQVIRGMKIDINLQQTGEGVGLGGLTSGFYNPTDDSINLLSLTMSDTFTHEVAHRWWFQILSGKATKDWEEWINNQSTCFEPFELDLITAAWKKCRGLNPTWEERRDIWDNISKHLAGNVKLKYDQAKKTGDGFRIIPLVRAKDSAEEAEQDNGRFRTFLHTYGGRKKFIIEYITTYANKNPKEAWAEVWRLYVEKKKVPPLTLDIFKRIIGLK